VTLADIRPRRNSRHLARTAIVSSSDSLSAWEVQQIAGRVVLGLDAFKRFRLCFGWSTNPPSSASPRSDPRGGGLIPLREV
jgi:hypothetical protein